MTYDDIRKAGLTVLGLIDHYSNKDVGSREMFLDQFLYAYLVGRVGRTSRQYRFKRTEKWSPRIDFRVGGPNPTLIELVVRPRTGSAELYGSQNRRELRKLCRVGHTRARRRALLLIDLKDRPLTKDRLKSTYDEQDSGRGRFKRHSVRVIYVHKTTQYSFKWSRRQ